MTQWVFIEPHDVWMFRDSKPFSAQQNFVARSTFPPNPMTIQGAVRTLYLESMGVNWKAFAAGNERAEVHDIAGTPETWGSLEISGPFVARWVDGALERLYPAPNDLLWNKDASQFHLLRPATALAGAVNLPFKGWRPLEGTGDLDNYKETPGWLTESQMADYLQGKTPAGVPVINADVYSTEERVGLMLNPQRRAAEEGYLYHAQFIRAGEGVGVLVGVNTDVFADTGSIGIGGENRTGHYTRVNYKPTAPAQRGNVKLVLQTPAYFREGWQPENGDWSKYVDGGRLVAASIGKPVSISGWNIARGKPKPLRHYVPAGSVFYFEDADLTGAPLTETPATEPGLNFGAMGFGALTAGTW